MENVLRVIPSLGKMHTFATVTVWKNREIRLTYRVEILKQRIRFSVVPYISVPYLRNDPRDVRTHHTSVVDAAKNRVEQ